MTADDLWIGWLPPPFFHPLPLDAEGPDEAADRLHALAEELLPTATDEERARLCLAYGSLLGDLAAAGAEYAGFCALEMDGRPSTASLALYRMPMEEIPPSEFCAATEYALRSAYPEDDVRIVDLPCGQAVVRIGDETFQVPPGVSGGAEPLEMLRGLIQVYVPLPSGVESVVLELGTPAMEDWDFYSELFAAITQTLNWSNEEDLLFLTDASEAFPQANTAPDVASRELYEYSSSALDILGLHGQVGPESRLSDVVCPDCRSAGHRTPCALLHEWCTNASDPRRTAETVSRAGVALRNGGWHETFEGATTPSFTALHPAGYRLGVALSLSGQRIVVKVLAPCRRPNDGRLIARGSANPS
ncbi:hypothetical protein ABT104_16795 [Streptomyces mobaraensis]|uniref:hypothetical protein n=1 Tax=Streptomyces mobaraensis TaxID=35621 RepID=UPI00332AED3B